MRYALLAVACAALLFGMRFTSVASAQAPAQRERWEYAWLTSSETDDQPFAWKRGSSAKNDPRDPVAATVKAATTQKYTFSSLLDEVGKEGWELVSVANNRDFYFKRRAN